MSETTRASAAAVAAGVVVAVLLWPTSNCRSTLIGTVPGQPDPNTRACLSVIGLPANQVAAIMVALLVSLVAYALVRLRNQ